jgi:hypothetical protein
MLIVSFDCEGIIHHEFLLRGQTEQGILSEGDAKVQRGNEEKKVRFVEGKKNGCSIMTMLQCIPPF